MFLCGQKPAPFSVDFHDERPARPTIVNRTAERANRRSRSGDRVIAARCDLRAISAASSENSIERNRRRLRETQGRLRSSYAPLRGQSRDRRRQRGERYRDIGSSRE